MNETVVAVGSIVVFVIALGVSFWIWYWWRFPSK